jgi:hypothetical protein
VKLVVLVPREVDTLVRQVVVDTAAEVEALVKHIELASPRVGTIVHHVAGDTGGFKHSVPSYRHHGRSRNACKTKLTDHLLNCNTCVESPFRNFKQATQVACNTSRWQTLCHLPVHIQ